MAQIQKKPLILEGFQTDVRPQPGSLGRADGTFQPTPVLSKGEVRGRHRVLARLPFAMLGCTNGGSAVGVGQGTIDAGQNVGTESGNPFHVHGDSGLCHGKLIPPTGTPIECCCKVMLRSDDSSAEAKDGRKKTRAGELALAIRDRATKRTMPGVAVWVAGGRIRTHAVTKSDGVRGRNLREGRCLVGAGFEDIDFDRPRVLGVVTGTDFVPVLLRTTRGTPEAPAWCLAEARAASLSAGQGLSALTGDRLAVHQLARFNWATGDVAQLNQLFAKSGRQFRTRARGMQTDVVLDRGEPVEIVVPRPFTPRKFGTSSPQELLVDVLDAPLAEWERLISFRPSAVVQIELLSRGLVHIPSFDPGIPPTTIETDWTVQRMENGVGDVNLDYYPVQISKLPAGFTTPEALLTYMRMHLNEFVVTDRAKFDPIAKADEERLASGSAVGGVVKITMHLGPAKEFAAVVLAELAPERWVFSTISTPGDEFSWDGGTHPVSGNREWGFRAVEGGYEFFTRGADRISSSVYLAPDALAKGASWVVRLNPIFDYILDYAPRLDPSSRVKVPIAFQGGHSLWVGFQERLTAFVNNNRGAAEVRALVSERHPWPEVQRVYHRPTGRWVDGRGGDVIVMDQSSFNRITSALREQVEPLTSDNLPNPNYIPPALDMETAWGVWKAIGCERYYVQTTAKGSFVVIKGYAGLRKFLRAPRFKDVLRGSALVVKEASVALGGKGLLRSALNTARFTILFVVAEDLGVGLYKELIGKAFDGYDLAATLSVDIAANVISSVIGYMASLLVVGTASSGAVVGFVPILFGIAVGFVVSVVIGAVTDQIGLETLVAGALREAFEEPAAPTGWAPLPPDGYAEKLLRYNGNP